MDSKEHLKFPREAERCLAGRGEVSAGRGAPMCLCHPSLGMGTLLRTGGARRAVAVVGLADREEIH